MIIVNDYDVDDDFKDPSQVLWHLTKELVMLLLFSAKSICQSFDFQKAYLRAALRHGALLLSHHHLFVSAADAVEAEEILMTMNFY